jgi:hypothetical protein
MIRFEDANTNFLHAMTRAREMINLFDALSALRPGNSANDDALRAAYFQAVSSFDFFAHEIAAVEARYRFTSAIATRKIHLPMEILTAASAAERETNAENHIRTTNSYKAFVDPAKLAELLSCYCEEPWNKISQRLSATHGVTVSADELKAQLKSIWQRRNKIAHEADINPALAGVSLWPIDKEDAESTINFLTKLATELPAVVATLF